jgi:uncharacterized membrane protein
MFVHRTIRHSSVRCRLPYAFDQTSRQVLSSSLPHHLPWIVRLSAPRRLAVVVALGATAFAVLPSLASLSNRLLVSWDVGAFAYLALAWMTIARADSTMTRIRAQLYDQSGYIIFLLVVTAACASIVAIGFVLGEFKLLAFWPRMGHLALSVAALILSWLLIQTLFAFHYARGYYSQDGDARDPPRGLCFPGNDAPDYFDFTYYSFVVGMTSQVSDVTVTARHMRRMTLVHGVLSFVFNIAIFAMSINIISGAL